MEKFEEILSKYETVKRSNKPKITFEEVEKIIGFKLPEDYKTYAIKYSEFEDMIGEQNLRLWNFDEIIAEISKYFTLKTGDLIFTGTPAGVGAVKIGDRLTAYIEDRKMLDFEIK